MPHLLECQGKRLLKECGMPVPGGHVASDPEEALAIVEGLSKGIAIRSQVATTGCFSAGGIKLAVSGDDAAAAADEILLGSEIK